MSRFLFTPRKKQFPSGKLFINDISCLVCLRLVVAGLWWVRDYMYAYTAVSPHTGWNYSIITPVTNMGVMNIFLIAVSRAYSKYRMILYLDAAVWHISGRLKCLRTSKCCYYRRTHWSSTRRSISEITSGNRKGLTIMYSVHGTRWRIN